MKTRSILAFALAAALTLGACATSPSASTATPAAPAAATPNVVQTAFQKGLADLKAFNGDLASAQGQQLLADAAAAAAGDIVAVAEKGANPLADASAVAGSVKAISDLAQLPSVESTTNTQVQQAISSIKSVNNTTQKLAPQVATIYQTAKAKGAKAVTVLTGISKGLTQAQANATIATGA